MEHQWSVSLGAVSLSSFVVFSVFCLPYFHISLHSAFSPLFQVWVETNGNMPAQFIMLAMYINLQMGEYNYFSVYLLNKVVSQ